MNLDRRLLRQARKSCFALALTIALGFAAGVFTVIQAGCLSRVVDRVFLGGQSLEQVAGLLAILLGVMSLRALLVWMGEMAANAIAARVKLDLRRALVERILTLGPAYARGERTGELANTAMQGVEALEAYFSQYLPGLALAALVPLTILAFVFPLDPLSGAVLLLTAPLIPVFMILIGNAAQALTRRQWGALSRMSAYFLDVLQGLTTLKVLGRSQAQGQVIAEVSERYRQMTMSVLRVTFLSALALEMVATLSTAVVAVQIGLRLLYGRLAFEQAFFILLLAPEFYLPLRLLGTRFHAGMSGVEAAKRIYEVLESRPQTTDHGQQATDDEGQTTDDGRRTTEEREALHVRFDNVEFTYEDGRQALRGVSFEIPAGGKVGLVGPSGGGKSSIAHLLLRFIQPSAGRITAGGLPLEGIPPQQWRQGVAWVSQDPYLFDDTIAANIRLAQPEATLDEVIRAAQAAHADEFIRALPKGYDTPIGEHGSRLSGGQAQRIALARAFLKDAWLVVLDEATANLDPEHEALLGESLERLLAGRSALMIAHRLNTVRLADQIIVLDRGRLIESGTQAELMARDGAYRRMAEIFSDEPVSVDDTAGKIEANTDLPPLHRHTARLMRQEEFTPSALTATCLPPSGSHARMHTLQRLLGLVSPFKGWVVLSILMGAATILSGVGLMSTSAYLISAAALQPSIADLQVAIVGVRFFGIARGVFRYLERYLSHQTTFRLLARLRVWFYQALEPLAPARLASDFHSGDLLARILGDIHSLEGFYVRALAPPLTAALTGLALCVFLARFDARLGLILALFLLAAGALVPALAGALGRSAGCQIVSLQAGLSVAIIDAIQGLADLVAFGREKRQATQIETLSLALAGAQRRMAAINGAQSALSGLLANLGMWAVLVATIPLVRSGQIQGVHLATLALAALTGFEAVLPLPLAAQYLESNLGAARRLFEVVDARPEVQDPQQPRALPKEIHLSVRDLRFRYPAGSTPSTSSPDSQMRSASERPWALDGLSFDLPQGKRLAIVGPSGAGKSTLAHLLLRFWEYHEGQILLNGTDLRQFAQDEWRQRIAFVSQNTYLFSASVLDNLRIAQPTAENSQVESATREAQIDEFIQSLPEGYQTWIGDWGLRLSGGERQRLAIARALLRVAPLLILDEPTANLDALTERRVLESIQRLMQGRTTLLITHRLVGMEAMDEIIVLDRGAAVERGRHAELLAVGGLYRRMWDLQRQI